MSDEVVDPVTPDPDDAALVAEVQELTKSPSEQQAAKIEAALIAAKRELRAVKKRNGEIEPIAARAADLDKRLESVTPILTAVNTNPKLLAEAMRIANGGQTRVSADTTDQPTDDQEASAFAENVFGFYLGDGVTPDVARARRAMDLMDRRNGRQTTDLIRPLAGATLTDRADRNLAQIISATDDEGVPIATEQSIREVAHEIIGSGSKHLLADEKVINLILDNAAGRDRRTKRTPRAPEEPMYLAPSGGRRPSAPSISPDERRALAAVGLSEADFKKSMDKLDKAGGKAVVLGS